jgi:hypothetical protein
MITLLENGSYLSTERLVAPGRREITRSPTPDNEIVMDRIKLGLDMDFTTIEATLMQVSCVLQEEKISSQGGFTVNRGILDLMALEEAGILPHIKTQVAQGETIANPWQLQNNFTIHHELFKQAIKTIAVNSVDWEQIDASSSKRAYLYSENFTSSFALTRMRDPLDNTKYGEEGYQVFTLVDSGDIVLTSALADI